MKIREASDSRDDAAVRKFVVPEINMEANHMAQGKVCCDRTTFNQGY